MTTSSNDAPGDFGRSGTRATIALVLGAVLLVAGASVYFAYLQNAENEKRHTQILRSEAREAANAVEQFVTGRQRLVEAFAYDNQELLTAYAEDVDDEDLRQRIDTSLRRWFPSYFTFTLANRDGTDLVDDLEGFVGRQCQENIQSYVARLFAGSNHATYETVIHPQANNYHFDIMAPWRSDGKLNGVFFVSFYPLVLQSLIGSYQSPGHHLALVHRDRENLIEVTADGARDMIAAHREIELTKEELREVRASVEIPGSVWRLVGFVEPGLVASENRENWYAAFIVLIFVGAAGALSLWKILALDREQARVLAQLRESNANLAELADEQAALRVAAEAGEKTKAQFLASMSHEIRTPLNAIIGLTDLTLQTELSDHQRGQMSRVARAGRSLLGLINDILDFSKIEAGKLQIEAIEFDIDEVLENLATVVSTKIEENANELVITVDRTISSVLLGDPLRLGQVLINLAGNSAKFTQRGEILIDVSRIEQDGREWLRCSVRDTGIGMSAAQVDNLFKPFTQADQSVTRTHGGTGLGLSISRELVEAMGGSIGVESAPGEGSTFYFHVPYLPVEGAAPRRSFEGIDPRATKVLVVDDNRIVRETLRETLTSLRFKVDVASGGEEAVELYRKAQDQSPFSVVLMDWRMPGVDGVEAIRRIQEEAARARVPAIIMVSAEDMQSIAGELRTLGVEHCVNKPINTSFLIDQMMAFFETGSDRRPVRKRLRPAGENPTATGTGIHVLLAEDVELNRMVALGVLENAGITADVAENGLQVLEALEREGPDRYAAVLMDIEMPEMDGLTATRKIREELGYTHLPVIAMTAHALAEERERCSEAGMVAHIGKPFEAAELISTINRFALSAAPFGKPVSEPGDPVGSELNETAERLMLPRDTVMRLQAKFRNEFGDSPAQLCELLESGAAEEARRLVHSLKGAASSLGLSEIADAAAEVEDAVAGGSGHPGADMLERFRAAHAQSMRALER
ncbi:response regulator [Nisaea acidiphila]|uniref:Sensory/regulatory protein RpfC n=1 Tax=Nisaea acidiphila TaxID=1862145 RepID=A0A9J7ATR9_9PROT|nr:response regulator [Nisaea acidiphila]UUX50703.1 response regulator [Nisaea acidiphila]